MDVESGKMLIVPNSISFVKPYPFWFYANSQECGYLFISLDSPYRCV